VRRPFIGEDLGHPRDAVFGRRVGGHADAALERQQRGDVDHRARHVLRQQRLAEGLAGEEQRLEVHVHHVVPVGFGIIDRVGPADDPGIVDEDRDAHPVEHVPGGHRVGEIEHQALARAARRGDLGDGFVTGPAPGADHMRALPRQRHRDGLTDAGIGAGHQCLAPLQRECPGHQRSSLGWMNSMSV